MAASNFKPSLSLVLAHEGGFVNHPKDPGGATNKGVTQAVYDAYRRYHGLKVQSVRHITPAEVAEIYAKNYWRLVRGDSLPCGFDYAVFDFAVNSGVSRATKYMQKLVGVEPDGVIGVITLAAVEAYARRDEEKLIAQYCANRVLFLRSLSTFPTFGKGWMRRVVGYTPGVQQSDTGVVDYATFMARRDNTYQMPKEIGSLPGEVPGKALTPPAPPLAGAIENAAELIVEAPPVKNAEDLKFLLPIENDRLAGIIEAGK